MGHRPGTTTRGKRKVSSIRGYQNLKKFTNFLPTCGPAKSIKIVLCQKPELQVNHSEVMRNDSESGDELVFLSPPEGVEPPDKQDTGASPRLRRSSRKRKSTTDPGMTRDSSSKKQRNLTGGKKAAEMPKTARTRPRRDRPPKRTRQVRARTRLSSSLRLPHWRPCWQEWNRG